MTTTSRNQKRRRRRNGQTETVHPMPQTFSMTQFESRFLPNELLRIGTVKYLEMEWYVSNHMLAKGICTWHVFVYNLQKKHRDRDRSHIFAWFFAFCPLFGPVESVLPSPWGAEHKKGGKKEKQVGLPSLLGKWMVVWKKMGETAATGLTFLLNLLLRFRLLESEGGFN